ncbi:hypothetical protein [Nitrospirillum pindoramense]|uniref:Uncharacterized protein n=1 Tax=Nitrospirillum amazonense TaxID=28077 RepID=A0A560GWX0_9PROT|nr:hypothetical protein [Nitrospirillum amazonense]TWB38024.1 hypothetical protein FBZ90_11315 [Nitrospirillum amazonense]
MAMIEPKAGDAHQAAEDAAWWEDVTAGAQYAAGMAAGLAWVARYARAPTAGESAPPPYDALRPAPARYRDPTPTQRPIIDIMRREAKPLSIKTLMALARAEGHDLIRPTVKDVLRRLHSRGDVTLLPNGRWLLVHL